jgi:hypothetical protein
MSENAAADVTRPRSFRVSVERRPAVIRHMINNECSIIIHVEPLRIETEKGRTLHMGFPALIVSGWIDEPEAFAARVAALLTQDELKDEGKAPLNPEPPPAQQGREP